MNKMSKDILIRDRQNRTYIVITNREQDTLSNIVFLDIF